MTHVRYIDKTRDYYISQGYEKPYQWAHFDDVPFTPLEKPLAESCVTLISTSEIGIKNDPETGKNSADEGQIGSVYSIPTKTPTDQLYARTHSYDKFATHLDDANAYFPVTRLLEAAETGRLGRIAPRLHGVFNAYSQRKTRETDAPELLKRCREDRVDVAVLVPV